jgi:hypothetical protein
MWNGGSGMIASKLGNRIDHVIRALCNRGFLLSKVNRTMINKNGKDAVTSFVTGHRLNKLFSEPWILTGLHRFASEMPKQSHALILMHFAEDVSGVGVLSTEIDGGPLMLNLMVAISIDGMHKVQARKFRDIWLYHPEVTPEEGTGTETKPYRTKSFEMLAELPELEEVAA